jgi:hypothetical protein
MTKIPFIKLLKKKTKNLKLHTYHSEGHKCNFLLHLCLSIWTLEGILAFIIDSLKNINN